MDRFKVDGQALREHYGDETLLQTVFTDIERELHAEGKVVCRFIVNGMALEERDEVRFAEYTLSEVRELEYLADDKSGLAIKVITGWMDALPELQAGAEELGKKVATGIPLGFKRDFKDILENCESLASSLMSLSKLMPEEAGSVEARFREADGKTMAALKEALHYIERKDHVQLAWTLEYDLVHALELWQDALKTIPGASSQGAATEAGGTASTKNSVARSQNSH